MTTTVIREKMHRFIDRVEDKKIKAIYTLLQNDIEEEIMYVPEFKAELDRRYETYQKDGKVITRAAMNKRVKAILSAAK